MGWWNVIQMLVALACIILLANFLLKKLNQLNHIQSKAIHILEKVPVSKSSSLCIVEIANSYYVMSIGEKGNDILKELSAEECREVDERLNKKQESLKQSLDLKKYTSTFKETLEKAKETYQDKF